MAVSPGATIKDGYRYRPRFSDSALAGATPSDEFIQGFKQTLLDDYRDLTQPTNFAVYDFARAEDSALQLSTLNAGTATNDSPSTECASSEEQGSTLGRSDIPYPLSLFDCFPEPPPVETMEHLAQVFRDSFLQKAPFLSSVSATSSSGLNGVSRPPPYLALSKALLASVFSHRESHRRWSQHLYICAVKTFVGAVELDNRTARNHLWYQAGILLVTFGMLQSNRTVWHTITMLNGYFFAPYKRCGLLQVDSSQSTVENKDLGMFTSFYFLVDLLRAIHTNTPPSIDPSQLSFPIAGPGILNFETIYQHVIFSHRPLEYSLTPDAYLLGLLCILSETVLFLHLLGPLISPSIKEPRLAVDDQINMLFQHPFAPSTATEAAPVSGVSHEYLHQVESLTMSLTAWHHSVQSPSPCNISTDTPSGEPRRSLVDGGILALAYLCRILLETGPRILTLPRALGYPPQSKNKSDQADGCASTGGRLGGNNNNMVQVSDVAMECAWKILQVCDNYDDGTASNNKDLSAQDEYAIPIWLPLATFYAGLIVWCRMRDDHSKGALEGVYHSASARRRIMKDFQSALGRMGRQLECATAMADTIQQLCS